MDTFNFLTTFFSTFSKSALLGNFPPRTDENKSKYGDKAVLLGLPVGDKISTEKEIVKRTTQAIQARRCRADFWPLCRFALDASPAH